jgi:AraC-like DNA-binding protein
MTSYDSSRPYLISSESPFELFICSVPKATLGRQGERICKGTALPLPASAGASRILRSFLCGIGRELEDGNVGEGSVDLGDCLLTMIRGIYQGPTARGRNPRPPAPVLLSEVKGFIVANLTDAALRPEVIARAHFISTRYLHKLFESESATVSQWIREQRLERCRRDLEDWTLRAHTVSEIGSRWGLRDASHFSHAFRARYGCSPQQARESALPDPGGS